MDGGLGNVRLVGRARFGITQRQPAHNRVSKRYNILIANGDIPFHASITLRRQVCNIKENLRADFIIKLVAVHRYLVTKSQQIAK